MLKTLDLFSGIGGFSLGLERTGGFETVAFCEIDPFCRRVLAKHWPKVPQYDDVRELTGARLAADGIAVDVICGGFPCQDISVAGAGAGLAGARSGLWFEYARIVGELRPRYVIVENVAALLGRGLGTVLGNLSSLGYDSEWHCIPAAAVGAPHRRDRLWLVARAIQDGIRHEPWRKRGARRANKAEPANNGHEGSVAHSEGHRPSEHAQSRPNDNEAGSRRSAIGGRGRKAVADAYSRHGLGRGCALQMGWGRFASEAIHNGDARGAEWGAEPDVGRVAHGVSSRVDRLGSLGNTVVPQIPEMIGRAILAAERIAA